MKKIRFYNVMFPIWFFYLYPTYLWLIIIPINFIIDSVVLYLHIKSRDDVKKIYKGSILSIFTFGFIADFLGALLIYGLYFLAYNYYPDVNYVLFPWTILISLPGVGLAGMLIYFFNSKISFKYLNLDKELTKHLSYKIAIYTAPYLMLIPIYG